MLVAGDPERKNLADVENNGGIQYHVNLLESLVSAHLRLIIGACSVFWASNVITMV